MTLRSYVKKPFGKFSKDADILGSAWGAGQLPKVRIMVTKRLRRRTCARGDTPSAAGRPGSGRADRHCTPTWALAADAIGHVIAPRHAHSPGPSGQQRPAHPATVAAPPVRPCHQLTRVTNPAWQTRCSVALTDRRRQGSADESPFEMFHQAHRRPAAERAFAVGKSMRIQARPAAWVLGPAFWVLGAGLADVEAGDGAADEQALDL
jgi:hypothetical protein